MNYLVIMLKFFLGCIIIKVYAGTIHEITDLIHADGQFIEIAFGISTPVRGNGRSRTPPLQRAYRNSIKSGVRGRTK